MTGLYRYIPHHMAEDASRMGWLIVGICPEHHGCYSVLGQWLCECPAPWHVRERAKL